MKHGLIAGALTALIVSVLVVRFSNTAAAGGFVSKLVGKG